MSFVASNYDKEREEENIILNPKYGLKTLKSAVVYGANASGKSKFFEGLFFMRRFAITSSSQGQSGDEISVEPFRLSNESENEPSEFEVIFVHKNIQYRYGFEVTPNEVISEWLFYKPKTKEVELFYRERQDFQTHSKHFKKGAIGAKEGLVRNNALLLSLAAQINEPLATNVIDWFKNVKTISGLYEEGYRGFTIGKARSPEYKSRIMQLLKAADLGIQDIEIEIIDIEKLSKEMPRELRDEIIKETKDEGAEFVSDILTTHRKFNSKKTHSGDVQFSIEHEESAGTWKFFSLTGPILDVLDNGYILVVDELDARLHPNLVCKIVSLFNSNELNPKNAQLVFNTHNTNLLDSGLFRRDQIWFTEKNRFGEASLYSLGDFKSEIVRNNEPFEDNYIRGKYGAVPNLRDLRAQSVK